MIFAPAVNSHSVSHKEWIKCITKGEGLKEVHCRAAVCRGVGKQHKPVSWEEKKSKERSISEGQIPKKPNTERLKFDQNITEQTPFAMV